VGRDRSSVDDAIRTEIGTAKEFTRDTAEKAGPFLLHPLGREAKGREPVGVDGPLRQANPEERSHAALGLDAQVYGAIGEIKDGPAPEPFRSSGKLASA
jgi:hypothetical protein